MKKTEKKNNLRDTVEEELAAMLASKDTPEPGRMQLVKVTIGYLAVQAKLEESEYGNWFNPEEGQEPTVDKPKRGRKSASLPSAEIGSFFDTDGGEIKGTGSPN